MTTLAVGLCTYRRPELLKKCLLSLKEMAVPEDIESFYVIVADNDSSASGADVVEKMKKNCKFDIHYSVEKTRGISNARNNVLNTAINLNVEYLSFIDDDEYVDTEWLINLWRFFKVNVVDVVQGAVVTVYEPKTPSWIIDGGFYQRLFYENGTVLHSAATNNCLFDLNKIVVEWNIFFDEKYNDIGGGDNDFFIRARAAGAKIKFTQDAVVYEQLEDERLNLAYLLKRKFRNRNTKLKYIGMNTSDRFKMVLKNFFLGGFLFFKLVFYVLMRRKKHEIVSVLIAMDECVAKGLGALSIYINIKEYRRK